LAERFPALSQEIQAQYLGSMQHCVMNLSRRLHRSRQMLYIWTSYRSNHRRSDSLKKVQ